MSSDTTPENKPKQWLPITYPDTLEPVPEDYDGTYREASRKQLQKRMAPVWNQFTKLRKERGFEELEAMETFLKGQQEQFKKKYRDLKAWAALPESPDRVDRTESRRFWEALATAQDVGFRLSVLRNVMWRWAMFDDSRIWGAVSESEKNELLEQSASSATPIPLKDWQELGPLFVDLCRKAGLIDRETDTEAATERLFETGEGEKVNWIAPQRSLIRIFDRMSEADLIEGTFWEHHNALLADHFLWHGKPLENKGLASQRRQMPKDGAKSSALAEIVHALREAQ